MNRKSPRLSHSTLKVLKALMDGHAAGISGSQITKAEGIAPGTLYPILARLEEAGWIRSRWETESPHELERPRRRYYVFTAQGFRAATNAFEQVQPINSARAGGLAWK